MVIVTEIGGMGSKIDSSRSEWQQLGRTFHKIRKIFLIFAFVRQFLVTLVCRIFHHDGYGYQ